MSQDNNLFASEQPPLMSYEKYPAEVRKLGTRGMQLFDSLQQSYLDKGFSVAEAFYHAASRTPEMFKAEQRKATIRFDPV